MVPIRSEDQKGGGDDSQPNSKSLSKRNRIEFPALSIQKGRRESGRRKSWRILHSREGGARRARISPWLGATKRGCRDWTYRRWNRRKRILSMDAEDESWKASGQGSERSRSEGSGYQKAQPRRRRISVTAKHSGYEIRIVQQATPVISIEFRRNRASPACIVPSPSLSPPAALLRESPAAHTQGDDGSGTLRPTDH